MASKEIDDLKKDLNAIESSIRSGKIVEATETLRIFLRELQLSFRKTPGGLSKREDYIARTLLTRPVIALIRKSDLSDPNLVKATVAFLKEFLELVVASVPHDIHELLETASKLVIIPTNFSFFLKYGRDEKSFAPELLSPNGKDVFTLSRPNLHQSISSHMLTFINWLYAIRATTAFANRLRISVEEPQQQPADVITSSPSQPTPETTPSKKSAKRKPVPLESLRWEMEISVRICTFLQPALVKPIATELLQLSMAYMLSLTDEELKGEDKKTMIEIGNSISSLLKSVESDKAVAMFERYHLQMAFKCFRSASLEKRIAGLTDIKDLCTQVLGRDKSVSAAAAAGPDALTPRLLMKYLEEQKILDDLYGENLHPELVKRSVDLARFMAGDSRELPTKYLDMMWAAAQKHESIAHVIYTAVADLAFYLSIPNVHYLYKKIESVPVAQWDVQYLTLLRTFTAHALSHFTSNKFNEKNLPPPFGLELLWKFVLETKPGEPGYALVESAEGFFAETIADQSVFMFRLPFLRRSMELLKHHTNVVPIGLRIIKGLICTWRRHDQAGPGDTRPTMINWLEKEYNLLKLLFDDLIHYKKIAHHATPPAGIPINSADLGGGSPHLQQIQDRMNFLDFLILDGGLTLTRTNLDVLWANLIETSLSPEERDQGYVWFEVTLARHAEAVGRLPIEKQLAGPLPHALVGGFLEEEFTYIFTEKLRAPTHDLVTISVSGLNLIEYIWRFLNWRAGAFEKLPGPASSPDRRFPPFVVREMSRERLVGVELLWHLLGTSQNDAVGTQVISLLHNVHKPLAAVLASADAWEPYVKRLMKEIEASRESNLLMLRRCLTLLHQFLDEYSTARRKPPTTDKTATGKPAPDSSSSSSSASSISVSINLIMGSKFELSMKSSDTIATLANAISQKSGIPIERMRLFYNVKQMPISSAETLEQWHVESGTPVYVSQREEPLGLSSSDGTGTVAASLASSASAAAAAAASSPASRLASDTWFHLLFSLLSLKHVPNSVLSQVWQILMMLPTNAGVLQSLVTLAADANGQANWDELLDSKSAFKLLFGLQIVNQLYDQGQADVTRDEWRSRFQSRGGVAALLSILRREDQSTPQSLVYPRRLEAVSLLLKILVNFLVEEPSKNFVASHLGTAKMASEEFLTLLRTLVLSAALAAKTLDTQSESAGAIDLRSSTERGLAITEAAISDYTLMGHAGTVSSQALLLSHSMIKANESLLSVFLRDPPLLSWIESTLVRCRWQPLRDAVRVGLLTLASDFPFAAFVMTTSLAHLLPSVCQNPKETRGVCKEYFQLFHDLLQKVASATKENVIEMNKQKLDLEALLNEVIALLSRHPVIEPLGRAEEETDYVLIGLTQLAHVILFNRVDFKHSAAPQLIDLLMKSLFDIATPQNFGEFAPPHCKSKASRTASLSVLYELGRGNINGNLDAILTKLIAAHNKEDRSLWNYAPSNFEKASCGYVGMRNLGATCYMNSLMQQLYMVPPLRYGVLQAKLLPDAKPDQEDRTSTSLLSQLQTIFSYLQELEMRFLDTRPFCDAYRCGPDNAPMQPDQQQDVDEFFQMLFDKLEKQLKGTTHDPILKDIFGGTIANEIISRQCAHSSEREEPFYTLSLDVKNKKNLQESLDLYVQGDRLEGENKWMCDACGCKVEALKRSSVKHAPNTLVIHLKRFDFDMETMRRNKINDMYEFPQKLNILPYTKEGLALKEKNLLPSTSTTLATTLGSSNGTAEKSSVEMLRDAHDYDLVGVLVHTGTADSGHYYSFIKERSTRNWYHFNDSTVETFELDQLSTQCFGGQYWDDVWDSQVRKWVNKLVPRSWNAYMLFYERKYRPSATPQQPFPPLVSLSRSDASKLIPQEIYEQIWQKNIQFSRDKNLFEPSYFSFALELLRSQFPSLASNLPPQKDPEARAPAVSTEVVSTAAPPPPPPPPPSASSASGTTTVAAPVAIVAPAAAEPAGPFAPWGGADVNGQTALRAIEHAVRLALDTLAHARARSILPPYMELLRRALAAHPDASAWFLRQVVTEKQYWLRSLLLQCDVEDVRVTFVSLLATALRTVRPAELASYTPRFADSMEVETVASSAPLVVSLLELVIGLLKDAPPFWRNFTQFFALFEEIASLGMQERKLMVTKGYLLTLANFFLGEESPAYKAAATKWPVGKMGDKFSSPNFSHLIACFALIARSCASIPAVAAMNLTSSAGESDVTPATPLAPALLPWDGDARMRPTREEIAPLLWVDLHIAGAKGMHNAEASAEMARHVAFENQDFSSALLASLATQICYALDFSKARALHTVAIRVLSVEDLLAEKRVSEFLTKVFKTITETLAPKMPHLEQEAIRFLVSLVTSPSSARVRQWFVERTNLWLEIWLVAHANPAVRELAAAFVIGLLPHMPSWEHCILMRHFTPPLDVVPAADAKMHSELFGALIELLPSLVQHTAENPGDPRTKGTEELATGWNAVWYCNVSRWIACSPELRTEWLRKALGPWAETYRTLDSQQKYYDENVRALLQLLHHMVHLNEPAVKILFSNETAVQVISTTLIRAPCALEESALFFNQTHVGTLLQLWLQCCSEQQVQPAIIRFLSSRYFFWLWRNIYAHSRRLYPQLESLFVKLIGFGFATGGTEFRRVFVSYLASFDALTARMSSSSIPQFVHSIELALQTDADYAAFLEKNFYHEESDKSEPLRGFENLIDLLRNLIRELNGISPSRAGPSPREKALIQLSKAVVGVLFRVTQFAAKNKLLTPVLARDAAVSVLGGMKWISPPPHVLPAAKDQPEHVHPDLAIGLLELLVPALQTDTLELLWSHWVQPNFYTAPEQELIRGSRSGLLVLMLRAAYESLAGKGAAAMRSLTKAAFVEVGVRALEHLDGVAECSAVASLLAASCGDRDLADLLRMSPRLPFGVLQSVRCYGAGGLESRDPILALMAKSSPEGLQIESQIDPLLNTLFGNIASATTPEIAGRGFESVLLLTKWIKTNSLAQWLRTKRAEELSSVVTKWSSVENVSLSKTIAALQELLNKK